MRGLDIRYFPQILDVIDQGIFTVDGDNRITSFNRAAERITGFPSEETIGKPCSEVFRTDLCAEKCPLRLCIGQRRPVDRQRVRIRMRNGVALSTCVFAAPLVSPDGELVGGIEVFHDLSESPRSCATGGDPEKVRGIVSRNPAMKRIFQQLEVVARSCSTLLITGESGTGKEVIARAIHRLGDRRDGPFVAVNCAAVPETLLEAELFGVLKGAFTDAHRDRQGRIARAEGGTLFLDEIGDLPSMVQVKLLRFLQDHRYEPLGTSEPVAADVRVIAATNRDLERRVREGRFRVDLFYRINVFQIPLPPLRQRTEDVPLLISQFIHRFRAETNRPIDGITDRALAALVTYPWPGNIRELENAIEHAFILCTDFEIDLEHLPPHVVGTGGRAGGRARGAGRLETLEREALRGALERHGGNRSAAARELGIHRTTLLRKLKRYGMG